MTAARVDLFVEQGATFTKSLLWKDSTGAPISNLEFSAKLQIRADYDDEDVILELTDISGSTGIALGGVAGTIDIRIGADDTATLNEGKIGVYDLQLIEAADLSHVVRLIRGSVHVTPSVSR